MEKSLVKLYRYIFIQDDEEIMSSWTTDDWFEFEDKTGLSLSLKIKFEREVYV